MTSLDYLRMDLVLEMIIIVWQIKKLAEFSKLRKQIELIGIEGSVDGKNNQRTRNIKVA